MSLLFYSRCSTAHLLAPSEGSNFLSLANLRVLFLGSDHDGNSCVLGAIDPSMEISRSIQFPGAYDPIFSLTNLALCGGRSSNIF
jgi:hypothetical protein